MFLIPFSFFQWFLFVLVLELEYAIIKTGCALHIVKKQLIAPYKGRARLTNS